MGIEKAYLMWVGSDSYPTIKDWTDEVEAMGVSKRLPNKDMGRSLLEEGSVIFVAHDEGSWHECPKCTGMIENPDYRKLAEKANRIQLEVDKFVEAEEDAEEELEEIKAKKKPDADEIHEAEKKLASIKRRIERRSKKIEDMEAKLGAMERYVEGGTGGMVELRTVDGDAEKIDHRQFDYWYHQPAKFGCMWKEIIENETCEYCGGAGRRPDAKVFGLFLPDGVEYIVKPEDDATVKSELEDEGFVTVEEKALAVESKRKCGRRKPGGVYVVTKVSKRVTKTAKEIVEELVENGVIEPEGVEIKGSFVQFLSPVEVDVKRFRGIKRWSLDPDVEDEADMILEALE